MTRAYRAYLDAIEPCISILDVGIETLAWPLGLAVLPVLEWLCDWISERRYTL